MTRLIQPLDEWIYRVLLIINRKTVIILVLAVALGLVTYLNGETISDDRSVALDKKGQSSSKSSVGKKNVPKSIEIKVPIAEDETKPVSEGVLEDINLTKKYLKESNHKGLLAIDIISKQFRVDKVNPDMENIRQWITVLYKDALQWRLAEQDVNEFERGEVREAYMSEFQELNPRLISVSSAHLKSGYLKELIDLINDINKEDVNDTRTSNYAMRARSLIRKRKRHSDSYFKTEMKNLFNDDSISLDIKLEHYKKYIDAGDYSLVKFGRGYFDGLVTSGDVDSKKLKEIMGVLSVSN